MITQRRFSVLLQVFTIIIIIIIIIIMMQNTHTFRYSMNSTNYLRLTLAIGAAQTD